MTIKEIRCLPLFKGIPDRVLEKAVLPILKKEDYKAGGVIFDEGSKADAFFIILRGEVEISKITDRETEGSKLIAILSEGEFFGEMAVFQMKPRSTRAVARGEVSLIRIRQDALFKLLQDDFDTASQIMQFIVSVLMERLRTTTQELAILYEVGRSIATVQDIRSLAGYVMGRILKDIETAEAGMFAVWNEFNEEFDIIHEEGFALKEGRSFKKNDPLLIWLARHKESFLSFDLEGDKRLQIPRDSPYRGLSLIVSPFISQDRLNGFILILNRGMKKAFSYSQMVLLSAISGYVAVAVENLKYRREEVDRSRLAMMKTRIT